MNFKEELVKELGLGAVAEETMLKEYVKACEAIAVRYHESEVEKLHIQNVIGSILAKAEMINALTNTMKVNKEALGEYYAIRDKAKEKLLAVLDGI